MGTNAVKNSQNRPFPGLQRFKKLALSEKSPIFEPEPADKFIQSFSLSPGRFCQYKFSIIISA
jgi:hypothetical protein